MDTLVRHVGGKLKEGTEKGSSMLTLFIYFCLCLVSVDAHGLSLVVASGIYTLVAVHRLLTVLFLF